MRWSKPRRPVAPASGRLSRERLVPAALVFTAAILLAFTLLLYSSPEEKRITIYSNAANYSLPVLERNGDEYIGLLEVFEPLGSVSAKANGPHWKFRYYDIDSDFTAGKTRARIRGSDYDLPASFLLENGRGLVPLSCLGTLMPRILGGPVTFNQNSRRLFVGNVAVHFTAQVSKTTPPKLVMNFTAPVNPMIATEPGKLRMAFNHEAVVAPGSQALTFDSKVIPGASFRENNGAAELVVAATVPLIASFANNGRTIIIEPVPQAAAPPPTASARARRLSATHCPSGISARQHPPSISRSSILATAATNAAPRSPANLPKKMSRSLSPAFCARNSIIAASQLYFCATATAPSASTSAPA